MIELIENTIIEEFKPLQNDWEAKYKHIINIGKSLPTLDNKHKIKENLIKGCQTQVWLHARISDDDKIIYTADSDAAITKGMIALIIRVLSNQLPQDIIQADLKFIDTINLKEQLSPTRSNGLLSMIKQMKEEAQRFL